MQPAPSTSLAPPPIPAMPQLSEKPHQGFATKKTALHPASSVPNFRVTLGLRAVVVENGVREIYSARYYNPQTGTFLSRDPQEYTPLKWTGPLELTGNPPLDPKKLHKYLYAGGDPINYVDPLGKSDFEEESDFDSIEIYQERSTGPNYRISIQKSMDKLDHVLDDIVNGKIDPGDLE